MQENMLMPTDHLLIQSFSGCFFLIDFKVNITAAANRTDTVFAPTGNVLLTAMLEIAPIIAPDVIIATKA